MPTYDYYCEKCGKDFEVFQSMKDARLEHCLDEGCDGRMKRRIGTGAGLIFKGSGFYETDYRSDSYKQAAKKESASAESSSSAPSTSTGSDGGGSSAPAAPSPSPTPAPAPAPSKSAGAKSE